MKHLKKKKKRNKQQSSEITFYKYSSEIVSNEEKHKTLTTQNNIKLFKLKGYKWKTKTT